MKKTNLKGKLSLNRETLHTLQPDALEDVQGGNVLRTVVEATRRVCPKVSQAVCTITTTVASHRIITCKQ